MVVGRRDLPKDEGEDVDGEAEEEPEEERLQDESTLDARAVKHGDGGLKR